MDVELLTPADEQAYEEMLQQQEHTLLYSSLKYRALLREYLNIEDYYLVVKEAGQIAGCLPLFLKRNSAYGNILNSLPFYGSNGGITVASTARDQEAVYKTLLACLSDLASDTDSVAATIITNPFERCNPFYQQYLSVAYQDSRIGQIVYLPHLDNNIEDAIMAMIHSSKRRNVRKARKSGVSFNHSSSPEALRFLADTHKENIRGIGGLAKDWEFFQKIPEVFNYNDDYRVYVAELDGRSISALLLLYYNNTVEYFTPATVHEYRTLQPGSLLIFEAMKDAIQRGYQYWNFGGTWHSQTGVYQFKKRWGALDMPYYYYVVSYWEMEHFLNMKPQKIRAEYQQFYVLPFEELNFKD